MQKQQIPILGMDCASCAAVIQRTLKKADGVASCEVNYGSESAQIEFDEKKTNLEVLSKKIEPLGYRLSAGKKGSGQHVMPDGTVMSESEHAEHLGLSQSKEQKLEELKKYKHKVQFTLPLALAVFALMLWEIATVWNPVLPKLFLPMDLYAKILLILSSIVLFWAGQQFLRGLLTFLRYGVAGMDTLIGIGTLTAYLYSVFVVLFPESRQALGLPETIFFDVTIVVIGFIILGKYLEMRSKLRTGEAIEKLLNLQAKTALVLRDGKEVEVPIAQVKVGDKIVVKPGAKLPVDGRILEGASSIDDSMVTGEFMPKDVKPGDMVVGGTVNRHGAFVFEATKVGSETLLAQIVRMVQTAQGSKAPIQNLADRISAVFVPVVLVIAFASLAAWLLIGSRFMPFSQSLSLGLLCFVSVLVIACPCALGLATPTAIIVGVGKGASLGILIKNAESLEKLRSVNTVVVDKTGTLTVGKPSVAGVVPVLAQGRQFEEKILQIAGSLEKKSEHPLAEAIIRKAEDLGLKVLPITDFKNFEGRGVYGKILGEEYFIGSPKFVGEQGAKTDEGVLQKLTLEGKTPVVVAKGRETIGILAISDSLKENTAEVVRQLKILGVEVVMATGDHENTARHVARELGIEKVFAQVLPQDKAMRIKELQSEGFVVAMAGDGINDAPALAQADVGVAMATGTDVAIESADITLLHGDLAKLLSAIRLARNTVRTVKQNLFWAFIYNLVGIPLATGIFYPLFGWLLNPIFAGAAMALSSVSVVANSLRLKQTKI
ncbi:MAG: cadmium-translocating P-type ATPase [Patescibacteria group bacterium]|nr:cadmium-translocating P-type ATPase [Patescibacteria group bacterium]